MIRAAAAGWPDLRDALRAEWTKLRTVRSTGWLLACSAGLTIAVSALTASIVKCPASCGADTTKVALTGVMLGQAAVAVLAVLVMSGEYSTGMIRLTMSAMPRRSFLLAAKAIVLAGVVLAAGTAAVLGSLFASRLLLAANGYTPARGFVLLSLYHGPTLRAAAGSVLYLGLIALLSLGIATAVRDSGGGDHGHPGPDLRGAGPGRARIRPALGTPLRAVRAHQCRARDPGDQGPGRAADRTMGRARRPRRLGRARAARRLDPAQAARRLKPGFYACFLAGRASGAPDTAVILRRGIDSDGVGQA